MIYRNIKEAIGNKLLNVHFYEDSFGSRYVYWTVLVFEGAILIEQLSCLRGNKKNVCNVYEPNEEMPNELKELVNKYK